VAPLLLRTAVFLALFGLISAAIGSEVVGRGIVEYFGFQVYGETGKALILSAVALMLLVRRKKAHINLLSWSTGSIGWLLVSVASLGAERLIIQRLLLPGPPPWLVVLAHMCVFIAVLSAALCVFGYQNLNRLWNVYRQEIVTAAFLGVVFIGFMYLLYGLWTYMSAIVLNSDRYLFNAIGVHPEYLPPRTLMFKSFGISVGEYCSGIDSMSLFSSLYILLGVLDWGSLNHRRYVALFVPAALILFGLNILRVFVLMLAGYYLNPKIAFTLFHTYAGMLLFLIYSAFLWTVGYGWVSAKGPQISEIKNA
jgi:exosortase/archaeosortase family protein